MFPFSEGGKPGYLMRLLCGQLVESISTEQAESKSGAGAAVYDLFSHTPTMWYKAIFLESRLSPKATPRSLQLKSGL